LALEVRHRIERGVGEIVTPFPLPREPLECSPPKKRSRPQSPVLRIDRGANGVRNRVTSKQDDLCRNRFTARKTSVKQAANSRAVKRTEPASKGIVGQIRHSVVMAHREPVQPQKTLEIVIVGVRNILLGAAIDEPAQILLDAIPLTAQILQRYYVGVARPACPSSVEK